MAPGTRAGTGRGLRPHGSTSHPSPVRPVLTHDRPRQYDDDRETSNRSTLSPVCSRGVCDAREDRRAGGSSKTSPEVVAINSRVIVLVVRAIPRRLSPRHDEQPGGKGSNVGASFECNTNFCESAVHLRPDLETSDEQVDATNQVFPLSDRVRLSTSHRPLRP